MVAALKKSHVGLVDYYEVRKYFSYLIQNELFFISFFFNFCLFLVLVILFIDVSIVS